MTVVPTLRTSPHTKAACRRFGTEVKMARKRRGKTRMGRPPRTDNPVRVGFMLPGAQRDWLASRSRAEERTQSDVLSSALALYRKHVARRKP